MRLNGRCRACACMCCRSSGFTLIETIISLAVILLGFVSFLNIYIAQMTLSEHARNETLALNDVTRVMERLRQQNAGAGCTLSAAAPAGFASWDAWLNDTSANGGGGKSIQPNPTTNELISVTTSGTDPLRVNVATCWRQRERVIGECTWDGTQLSASDSNGDGIINSPVATGVLLTCHSI